MLQADYKKALDDQRAMMKELTSNGNMTAAEKMLNRQGLQAYKNKIDKPTFLVPGISPHNEYTTSSYILSPEVSNKVAKNPLTLQEKQTRLAKFGFKHL